MIHPSLNPVCHSLHLTIFLCNFWAQWCHRYEFHARSMQRHGEERCEDEDEGTGLGDLRFSVGFICNIYKDLLA